MATYTGAIMGGQAGYSRINERPAFIVSQSPATFEGKRVNVVKAEVLATAPTYTYNSKDEKVGIVISAMPAIKAGGSTTITRSAKYPRMSPLEICWTKANK